MTASSFFILFFILVRLFQIDACPIFVWCYYIVRLAATTTEGVPQVDYGTDSDPSLFSLFRSDEDHREVDGQVPPHQRSKPLGYGCSHLFFRVANLSQQPAFAVRICAFSCYSKALTSVGEWPSSPRKRSSVFRVLYRLSLFSLCYRFCG